MAHLEQPERLERLSRAYLNMAPVGAPQETTVDNLYAVSRRAPGRAPEPAPVQASVEPPPVAAEVGSMPVDEGVR